MDVQGAFPPDVAGALGAQRRLCGEQEEADVSTGARLGCLVGPRRLHTLRGAVVLALLPEQSERDLLQGRVQAPAAGLVLPGRVDGLVLQQLGRGAASSRVPLQSTLQEGAHAEAAVLGDVLQRGGLLVDLPGQRQWI